MVLVTNNFLLCKLVSKLVTIFRAVKMGYNPRANPAHHGFGPGWVEKKLQISVRVKNEPNPLRTRLIRVEPVISQVGANKF